MRLKTLPIVTLVPLLGGVITLSEKLNINLSISERRLQSKLSELFPVSGKRYGVTFSADTPYLRLKDDGFVHFGTMLSINYLNQGTQAYIEFIGQPSYCADAKGFYVLNLQLASFRWVPRYEQDKPAPNNGLNVVKSLLNIDDQTFEQIKNEALKKLSDYLLKRFREKLSNEPFYVLDSEKHSQRFIAYTMSGIAIKEGQLKLEFSWLDALQTTLGTSAFILAVVLLAMGKNATPARI